MKYSFLIVVVLLMLLPEVSPGNQLFFGIRFPNEDATSETAVTENKSLSNCPATADDSYLKQAFCSCKTLFTEVEVEPKIAAPVKPEAPKTTAQDDNYFSRFFSFAFVTEAAE